MRPTDWRPCRDVNATLRRFSASWLCRPRRRRIRLPKLNCRHFVCLCLREGGREGETWVGEGHPTCVRSNELNVNLIALKARSSLTLTVIFQSLSKGKKVSIGNSQACAVNETCVNRSPVFVLLPLSFLSFFLNLCAVLTCPSATQVSERCGGACSEWHNSLGPGLWLEEMRRHVSVKKNRCTNRGFPPAICVFLPFKPNNVETRQETVFEAPTLDMFYAFKPLIIITNMSFIHNENRYLREIGAWKRFLGVESGWTEYKRRSTAFWMEALKSNSRQLASRSSFDIPEPSRAAFQC